MLTRHAAAQAEARPVFLIRSSIATAGLMALPLLLCGPALAQIGLPDQLPCAPTGQGRDYAVGPDLPYPTLESVPWEQLGPGDTVRIAWSPSPYRGKILLAAQGTAESPVRICGQRGPSGQRPQIDGRNAVTRAELAAEFGSTRVDASVGVSSRVLQQARGIIVIDRLRERQGWKDYPRHIRIDGLAIGHARPEDSFRDAEGRIQRYRDFGACIWLQRGQHITIADNEIHDCVMGVFSRSTDEGDFELTRDLLVRGNHFHGHGLPGDDKLHSSYTQSVGTTIEFNRYGPLHPQARGHSIKDRSVGTVVRYNLIEAGAHAIDLVEAEDFPRTATADPAYRSTFVYGNRIVHRGEAGSVIHYGGDHFDSAPGKNWGEPIFRHGTLYFYGNSVRMTGGPRSWLFQLSTTEESAEIFDNHFLYDRSVTERNWRMQQEVGRFWQGDGILRLGPNRVAPGLVDNANPWIKLGGRIDGLDRPIDRPSGPIDAYPVQYQIDESGAISQRHPPESVTPPSQSESANNSDHAENQPKSVKTRTNQIKNKSKHQN
jgi:hypothetical protein